MKPALDRLFGTLLALVAAPLIGLVALAVRTTMGAPVLVRQQRVGQHGVVFTMYKFRSMHPDRRQAPDRRQEARPSTADRRVCHKSKDDPRITPLGRSLRAWSLDELPQLWNVARGDMSLVGPRPELVHLVAGYASWQHDRHAVKPGLTGLWQVTERGSDALMHERVDLDLEYVNRLSFRMDVWLMLRTVLVMFGAARGY